MKTDKKNRLKRKKQNQNPNLRRKKRMMDGSQIRDLTQIRKMKNRKKQKKTNRAINHKNKQMERTKKKTTRMTGKQIQMSDRYPTEN